MKRILFVDDESNILDGLRRMLRPLRQEWSMEFASSGREALDKMQRDEFDVVVSDMRMPEMDGAQLLAQVLSRSPRTVRVILTGQSSREATLRAMRVAHRMLTKPCDPELLRATVQRICALRELLAQESLASIVSQQVSLPTLPACLVSVMREVEAEEPSLQRIGNLIAQDIGLTAKVLQVVNSAFYGLSNCVTSPHQATKLLGVETIHSIVTAISILSQFNPTRVPDLSLESLWRRSREVSAWAGLIAKAEHSDLITAEFASLAGLLHATGILILASQLPDKFAEALGRVRAENIDLCQAEREVIGASHPEVGAYLLGLWGLPDLVVEAVAWHGRPIDCPSTQFSPVTAVHAAVALVDEETPSSGLKLGGPLNESYLERLGLLDRLQAWRDLRPSEAVLD